MKISFYRRRRHPVVAYRDYLLAAVGEWTLTVLIGLALVGSLTDDEIKAKTTLVNHAFLFAGLFVLTVLSLLATRDAVRQHRKLRRILPKDAE